MADKIPSESPGKSYAQALLGNEIDWSDVIFHEFENTRMIRNDRWKYTRRYPEGPNELYDIQNDPGERNNLVDDSEYASTIKDLRDQLDEFFNRHADPKYDLWRDGTSKAGRMIKK